MPPRNTDFFIFVKWTDLKKQPLLMVRRGATDPLGHRGGLDAAWR